MKTRDAFTVGATMLVSSLGGLSAQAQLFTMDTEKPDKLDGSLHELGPKAADIFKAWAVARIDGAEYFTKDQATLRREYIKVGNKIKKAVIEDRLQESAGRQYFKELLEIGKRAKEGKSSSSESLKGLDAAVQGSIVDKANASTLTPRLNKLQWSIGEIALYVSDTSAMSSGKQSMVKRRLLALEQKEESAKKDKEISDRERERLMKSGLSIWKIIVEDLRKE
jgi:hypothetical protein